jgi:Cytochrome P450
MPNTGRIRTYSDPSAISARTEKSSERTTFCLLEQVNLLILLQLNFSTKLLIIGKRQCIGESLARNTYYLFVAALVKTFRFSAVAGQPLPTLNPKNGVTLGYEGFPAITHRR